MDQKVSTESLGSEHRRLLFQGVQNVLNTEYAEDAMSQLLDGLPRYQIAENSFSHLLDPGHPLCQHETTCSGVLDRIRQSRDEFNPDTLHFDPQVRLALGILSYILYN